MLVLRVIQQIENKAIIFLLVFCSFPSFSINYFHSDAHGTVLEKIIGYSTGVNEFVLAIDSENESLEQGLLERRVLLRWDVVDKEWHRIKIGQQIIEREFKEWLDPADEHQDIDIYSLEYIGDGSEYD